MADERNLLVLTVDGLANRDLGPYGNTWIETPGFDRLGSVAWLAETMIATRLDLRSGLAEMLFGGDRESPILRAARDGGWTSLLLTDARTVRSAPEFAGAFETREEIEIPQVTEPAGSLEETHCAQFVARLLELRESAPQPHLLWAHYAGLPAVWDAPTAWRRQLELDEEVEAPEWIVPPGGKIDPDREADRRLQVLWAWAAQIMVVDRCLEVLWEALEGDGDTDLIVTSPRGFPLGEHGQIGFEPATPYSEMTVVPCLAFDRSTPAGWRELSVVATTQVARLISDWLAGRPFSEHIPEIQPVHVIRCPDTPAVRQGPWLLVRRGEAQELYAKPDDRWEVNDVSQRCRDIVDELGMLLAE